jgi:hypothetical protein
MLTIPDFGQGNILVIEPDKNEKYQRTDNI